MKRVTVVLEVDERQFAGFDDVEEKMECIENMVYAGIEDFGYDIKVACIDYDE